MNDENLRAYLGKLQAQRQELDTVITFVQKELGIQSERKRPEPKPRPDHERGPRPDPAAATGWRDFVRAGAAAGYTMKELSPMWKNHKHYEEEQKLPF